MSSYWIQSLFTPVKPLRSHHRLLPGVERLEDRLAPAIFTWDGGGADLLASNPLNWTTDTLPTAEDTLVLIAPASGTIQIHFDAAFPNAIHGLRMEGSLFTGLQVSFSNLTITDSFVMNCGSLIGFANLSIGPNARFEWLRGTIGGTTLQIGSGACVNVRGVEPHYVQFASLSNSGSFNFYDNATISAIGEDSLQLDNVGTLNFYAAGAGLFGQAENPISFLGTSTGSVNINTPGGEARLKDVELRGAVHITSGALALTGTGVVENATLDIADRTFLVLADAAEYSFQTAVSVLGNGTVVVTDNSEWSVNCSVSVGYVSLLSGKILGNSSLTVTGEFYWLAGQMDGSGDAATVIAEGATLAVSRLGGKGIANRSLDIFGKVTYCIFGPDYNSGPPVDNNPYANFLGTGTESPHLYASFLVITNCLQSEFNFSVRSDIYAYQAYVDDKYYGYVNQLRTRLATLRDAEDAAAQGYSEQEEVLAAGFEEAISIAQTQYEIAVAVAEVALAAAPEGDVAADEAYWDALSQAEADFDQAAEWAVEAYTSAESSLNSTYTNSIDAARTTYANQANGDLTNFRADLHNSNAPGVVQGAGLASQKANWFHDLITEVIPIPEGFDTIRAAAWTAFLDLDPVHQTAASTAYFRLFNQTLTDALTATGERTYGNPPPAVIPSPSPESSGQARLALGNFADDLRLVATTIVPSSALDGMQQFTEDTWNYGAGFVRDVGYLLDNDPAALTAAIGEGVRDGSMITANTLTFGIDEQLNQQVTEMVQQNGGMYRVSQVSAVIARESIISLATAGTTRLAAGAGQLAATGLMTKMGVATATQANVLCSVQTASRLYQPWAAYQQFNATVESANEAYSAFNRSDYETAAVSLMRSGMNAGGLFGSLREATRMARAIGSLDPQRMRAYFVNCFAAGTPIRGEFGAKPIEAYQVGDRVWARREDDPNAPAELKPIEQCFVSQADVWHVHVSDQVIRTTDEHPFFVRNRGWTDAKDLQEGDILIGLDLNEGIVEEVYDTGEVEAVYNFRVADHHTYFVGGDDWHFAVWAHNSCVAPVDRPNMPKTTANGYNVAGKAQNTTGTASNPHAAGITAKVNEITAQLQAQGIDPKDVSITLNRSWGTALNNLGAGVSSGANSRLRPDIIVVIRQRDGTFVIRPFECGSTGQNDAQLRQHMIDGFSSTNNNGNFSLELNPGAVFWP